MRYTPIKGFSLIGAGVVFDLLVGNTGYATLFCFLAAWCWSTSGIGEDPPPPGAVAYWHTEQQARRINESHKQEDKCK